MTVSQLSLSYSSNVVLSAIFHLFLPSSYRKQFRWGKGVYAREYKFLSGEYIPVYGLNTDNTTVCYYHLVYNHLVRKRTLNHLAKLAKRLWIRIPLQSRIIWATIRSSYLEVFCRKRSSWIFLSNSQENNCVGVSFLIKLQAEDRIYWKYCTKPL